MRLRTMLLGSLVPVAALLPSIIAAAANQESSENQDAPQDFWRVDLAQASAEATRDGRPLLVVFR